MGGSRSSSGQVDLDVTRPRAAVAPGIELVFDTRHMDRRHELEILKRSIAMLTPGQVAGLERDQALEMIEEIEALQRRMRRLKAAIRELLEDDGD